jgi:F-type H+-transporting ATPase subunit b
MKRSRRILVVLWLAPLFLSMTAGEAAETTGTGEFVGEVINFAVLFGLLVYFLRKPLRAFLGQRIEGIRSAIGAARAAKHEAQNKLDEADRRMAALEEEGSAIQKEAELEGSRQKENISALAEKEAERIRSYARQEVDLQLKAGLRELKSFSAERATRLAAERLRARITEDGHYALIDQSIERLAKLHEGRDSR